MALTDWALLIVSVHAGVVAALQAPLQPVKARPGSGVAVSVPCTCTAAIWALTKSPSSPAEGAAQVRSAHSASLVSASRGPV